MPPCPFCPGREGEEGELYRVSTTQANFQKTQNTQRVGDSDNQSIRSSDISDSSDTTDSQSFPSIQNKDQDWLVRVLPNKFPFTPHHEVIIHSPDHDKNIDELPLSQVILLLKTYKQRFQAHVNDGFVYIFHNRGLKAGESLSHPHSQLTVISKEMMQEIPTFASGIAFLQTLSRMEQETYLHETAQFRLFSPLTAQWPDELWLAPKRQGTKFDAISDTELEDLAVTLQTLVQIYNVRHGQEFPVNLYIYPGVEWYLRLIPRDKTIGGFEVGTGIFVNTQDPKETMAFIKTHLSHPDLERIKKEHKALYHRAV